ncbi:MAG: RNA polymerase sigma factor [Enterococcus sp.]
MLNYLFLVKKAQAGDNDSFIKLVKKYELVLYKLSFRYLQNEHDVEDALQETILIAFKEIKNLKKAQYFNTWITKILINQCRKILTNRKFTYLDKLEEMPQLELKDTFSYTFNEILPKIDMIYREPIILHYYVGFSYEEISKLLDLPLGTVKSRISRGKNILKIEYISLEESLNE